MSLSMAHFVFYLLDWSFTSTGLVVLRCIGRLRSYISLWPLNIGRLSSCVSYLHNYGRLRCFISRLLLNYGRLSSCISRLRQLWSFE